MANKKKNNFRNRRYGFRISLPLALIILSVAIYTNYIDKPDTSSTYKSDIKQYAEKVDTFVENSETKLYEGHQSSLSKEITSEEHLPKYQGKPYAIINNNIPDFSKDHVDGKSFEYYSPLDGLGRCGYALSKIGKELMPTKKRQSISSIKPTGWKISKYHFVDGKYLYNRCHLIAHQLTGEDANEKNLITGTRYMNTEGMLPFENMVADYIKETNNHVMYRVTPIFLGNELIARGVQIEAYSVEDKGEGISFNVYVFNVQPHITIDYLTGNSRISS